MSEDVEIEREIKEFEEIFIKRILKEARLPGPAFSTIQKIGAVLYNHQNGVGISDIQSETKLVNKNSIYKVLDFLQKLGWVEKDDSLFKLTDRGRKGMDYIAL